MKNKGNLNVRKVQVQVKDKLITFEEQYLVNEYGEEVFDRDLEIVNDLRLYDIYKKQSNLLTSADIKRIRNKYELSQKDYAFVIGLGEVTVHRFENGAIQTEAVDSIMRLSNDPDNMFFLVLQNKNNLADELYNKILKKVQELRVLKKHKVIDITKFDTTSLEFYEESVKDVAQNIIKIYNEKIDRLVLDFGIIPEYITNLKLQKLLYYVQAMGLKIFGKKAFPEKILAWSYGPVINEVYQEYKKNHKNEIKTADKVKKISNGLEQIIREVVEEYGSMEAVKLIDFTHEESPWKNTEIRKEIEPEKILDYFNKVYDL